jgi:hypothetical protein
VHTGTIASTGIPVLARKFIFEESIASKKFQNKDFQIEAVLDDSPLLGEMMAFIP